MHVVCGLVAFSLSVPLAHAAATPAGTVELSLSYNKSWTGWGTTGEELGGGIGGGIAYWRAVSPDLSWGVEASYDRLGKLEYFYMDPFSSASGDVRFDAKILRFNPAFRVRIGPPQGANFLAQVGAGIYNVNVHFRYNVGFLIDDDDSKTKFGFNVGAGVGFPLGGAKRLSILASYHVVNGEEAFAEDFNHVQARAAFGVPL